MKSKEYINYQNGLNQMNETLIQLKRITVSDNERVLSSITPILCVTYVTLFSDNGT